MTDGPKAGLAALIAAKLVCCGGLVLVATGALSLAGVAGWLQEGGFVWLAFVGLAVVAIFWWRSRYAHVFGVFASETRNYTLAVETLADTPGANSAMPDAKATSLRVEGMTCVRSRTAPTVPSCMHQGSSMRRWNSRPALCP